MTRPPILFRGRAGSPARPWSVSAAVVTCVLALTLAVQAALGGPASALPAGAYWYSLLKLPQTWAITKGAGVTVAVIDSGVQASLGDLRGQVLPGLDLTGHNPGAQHETRAAGTVDFGHGTDMAALIAGTGHGGGLVGVAPQAKILPVDAYVTSRGAPDSAIATGIRWSVDHHAGVINISLGGPGTCTTDPTLAGAVRYAYQHDVIVVAAAGDAAGPVVSPANCPGALTVGAVDGSFRPWSKTASGPEVDFVAPGYNLVNEELDGTARGPNPGNSGTSQATAIASGTFALLRAKFPSESARQIVTRALHHVHNGLGKANLGTRINDTLGYGMILPYFALTEATPANAANPIYDRFAGALGSASASASPSPGVTGSSGAAHSPVASSSAAAGSAPARSSGGSSSSPVSPLVIVLIVLVVVAGLALGLGLRHRHRRPPPGAYGGPPPPGWGGR